MAQTINNLELKVTQFRSSGLGGNPKEVLFLIGFKMEPNYFLSILSTLNREYCINTRLLPNNKNYCKLMYMQCKFVYFRPKRVCFNNKIITLVFLLPIKTQHYAKQKLLIFNIAHSCNITFATAN